VYLGYARITACRGVLSAMAFCLCSCPMQAQDQLFVLNTPPAVIAVPPIVRDHPAGFRQDEVCRIVQTVLETPGAGRVRFQPTKQDKCTLPSDTYYLLHLVEYQEKEPAIAREHWYVYYQKWADKPAYWRHFADPYMGSHYRGDRLFGAGKIVILYLHWNVPTVSTDEASKSTAAKITEEMMEFGPGGFARPFGTYERPGTPNSAYSFSVARASASDVVLLTAYTSAVEEAIGYIVHDAGVFPPSLVEATTTEARRIQQAAAEQISKLSSTQNSNQAGALDKAKILIGKLRDLYEDQLRAGIQRYRKATDSIGTTGACLETDYLTARSAAQASALIDQLAAGQDTRFAFQTGLGGPLKALGRNYLVDSRYVPLAYRIAVTKKVPDPLKNLKTLAGFVLQGEATAIRLEAKPNAFCAWRRLDDVLKPSDMNIRAMRGDGDEAKELSKTLYDNERKYLFDFSLALPVRSFQTVKFDTENNQIVSTKTEREDLFAMVDLYLWPTDTKKVQWRLLPQIMYGFAITGKPWDRQLLATGLGTSLAQPFVGISFNHFQTQPAVPGGDPGHRWVRKLAFGINFQVATAAKLFAGK